MTFARPLAPLALALACARPAPGPGASPADRPYVVLVSFDGVRADYLDRQRLPNFARVAAAGVRARGLVPTFPSKTFPSHYAVATGVHAGRHGIVANTFWDPARAAWYAVRDTAAKGDGRWYGAEPIWVTAERQGVRAGSLAYPGGEAAVGGVRASAVVPFDERVGEDAHVDSAVAWLRRPASTRPHFVALYVDDVDRAGHAHGPDAPQTDSAVAAADRLLGRLLDGIAATPAAGRTNVVVVSDHGMSRVPRGHVVDVGRLVDLAGVRTADPGPVLMLYFDGDTARRDRTHAALARALEDARLPVRVYRREATPARWLVRDQPRAGDLLVVAAPGWVVTPRPVNNPSPGQHGWDPDSMPEMRGIFLAAGPDVAPLGTIPTVRGVDVYPFLARLLRVTPAPGIDGSPAALRSAVRAASRDSILATRRR
jgi:predicted AlkP superfamily pyrophosphatase or phosphodiesterase